MTVSKFRTITCTVALHKLSLTNYVIIVKYSLHFSVHLLYHLENFSLAQPSFKSSFLSVYKTFDFIVALIVLLLILLFKFIYLCCAFMLSSQHCMPVFLFNTMIVDKNFKVSAVRLSVQPQYHLHSHIHNFILIIIKAIHLCRVFSVVLSA